MFKKIMLGYDGSSYAKKALSVAGDLAKKYGAQVTAVGVAHIPVFTENGEAINVIIEDTKAFLAAQLEEAKAAAAREGLKLEVRTEMGHPAEVLIRLADQEGYSLIVVGSRGLGGIQHLLLGSVSEATVRHAHCPVLVVKE